MIIKDPAIDGYVYYDFSSVLAGQSIASISSVTITPTGALASPSSSINGNVAQVYFTGGRLGASYQTKVEVQRADGAVLDITGVINMATSPAQITPPTPRLVRFPALQTITPLGTGIPAGAQVWLQPYDPSDHAPFYADFSGLMDAGESINRIEGVTPGLNAGDIGVSIDQSSGFAPSLLNATTVQFWPIIAQQDSALPAFDMNGAKITITIRVTTNAAFPRTWERTGVLNVRQL